MTRTAVGQTSARVVVVGAGFGGLTAARRLGHLPVSVTLIDRHNYHLFTPFLYQVATAGLEPEEIAHPVRPILRRARNVAFRVAEVANVDFARRVVETGTGAVEYDYLILAAGSTNNYFGLSSVEAAAVGLKDLDEALELRNRILRRFEEAAWDHDPAARAALLTFVVVGGGPTGVEFAGALRELIGHVLPHDFPDLDFSGVRVVLLEAAGRLLAPFDPKLQRAALRSLRKLGVEVRLNSAVERLEEQRLVLKDGSTIASATVMWAAGVRAADLAAALAVPREHAGRISVLPTLQLAEHPEVFVVGDLAAVYQDGQTLPMLAQVAIQGAACAVTNIDRLLAGAEPLPFRYRDPGTMATIGRNAAVAQIGRLKVSGFVAWVLWLAVHIRSLIGFRNRLFVMLNWAYNYVSYDRAVRLILGRNDGDRRA